MGFAPAALTLLALYVCWRVIRFYFRPSSQGVLGKAVVITGCDSGFGRALAERFDRLGAHVFAGCMSKKSVEELETASQAAGGKLKGIVMDVTKDEDVQAAVERVQKSGLELRAVINNAGISAFGYCEFLPMRRYVANCEVNYFGVLRVTKAFMPLLRRFKGRLINMGSIGDRMPSGFGSAYLSTKAAVASFSDCLRQEVHRFGVKVCLIEPGFFATSLLQAGSTNGANDTKDLPAEVLKAYGDYSSKMAHTAEPIQIFEKLNGSLDAVSEAAVDAATAYFPDDKYVVGWDANLILRWLPYLPPWIVDWAQTLQG